MQTAEASDRVLALTSAAYAAWAREGAVVRSPGLSAAGLADVLDALLSRLRDGDAERDTLRRELSVLGAAYNSALVAAPGAGIPWVGPPRASG